jgi:hypothetical protein
MTTLVTILMVWLALSLPVALVLGRLLRTAAAEQSVPVDARSVAAHRSAAYGSAAYDLPASRGAAVAGFARERLDR